MKKIISMLSLALMLFGFSAPAEAECNGWYLGARAGAVSHDVSDDSGFLSGGNGGFDDEKLMLAGSIGYRYEWFRSELSFVWRDYVKEGNERLSQKFKTYSYMMNFYWDILPYNWLTPYVDFGLGFSKVKYFSKALNRVRYSFDSTRFTWAVGGGLSLKMTNRWNIDVGYRYYDMGRMGKADVTAQEVYVGTRYIF